MKKSGWFFLITVLWYLAACRQGNTLSPSEKSGYMQQGANVVNKAAHLLQTNLKQAMADSGTAGAIQFCNSAALPLTKTAGGDSFTYVKRTSLKLRNPANKPTDREKMVLKMFDEAAGRKESIGPTLDLGADGHIFYYHPIKVQPLCLNCHGKVGENITEDVFNKIRSLYPKDKAMGYSAEDFRGVWVVKLK